MPDDNLNLPAAYAPSTEDSNNKPKKESAFKRATVAINTLAKMTGMSGVVDQISQIIASDMIVPNSEAYIPSRNHQSRHMVFEGNPGTGKTTVARLMGDIFHGAGVLANGNLIEAKGSDLIGKYVGHTGPKIKDLCEQASGGVLFIDEAYSLSTNGQDSFRDDAITELVALMEEHRDDFILILAGYPDKMREMLKSNPGLKSRVPYTVRFDDYGPKELERIFRSMAVERGIVFEEGVVQRVVDHLEGLKKSPDVSFANGRDVRNIVQYLADHANIEVFGRVNGIPRLRNILNIATGLRDLPDIENITVQHAHFDAYIQSIGGGPVKERMGFDLSPRNG